MLFTCCFFSSKCTSRASNSLDPNHCPTVICAESLLVPEVSLRCAKLLHLWKVNGPELKCLQRVSVEKTQASEDKILHFMACDISSFILSRICLAFLFVNFFSLLYLYKNKCN